jgi:cobalt transporter subunit CbtA
MIRRMFLAAIAAGLLAGLLITAVQTVTTTPIILHAEKYEHGGGKAHKHDALLPGGGRVTLTSGNAVQLAHAGHGDAATTGDAAAFGGGLDRLLHTGLANLVLGVGFALLLVACFALYGRPVDARRGVLWGLAGFAVFTLAPGLGLPPEVPGAKAAALTDRQIWWACAAAAAALGLWLMVFARQHALKVLGVVVVALPHLVGAPHPAEIGGKVPAELAGHFAAASIVVSAIFWASLGWLGGTFWQRLAPAGQT